MKLGGKGKPSELPQVYSRKVAVSATSALRTKETLTFGKTATIVVTLERVATEVVDTLTASSSQPLTPAQAPGFRVKEEARALAEVAAALRDKASAALEGSVSHKFLSQWGSVLAEVGQNLAPLISCLPFGEVLVSAAAGLFSAVMGRGAVLELGVDVCGQTALVLRVLCQPQVLKLIISDPSTHHLLERLVELLKQTVSILEDYNQSGVLYQLWKASGKLECIQQKSDDIRSLFTSLHQLTTFRAHAAHANDLQSVLEVVNAMQVLTAEGLSEHLLPQLTWLINSSEARAQTAVAASGKSVNEALTSMKTQLSADLNKMALDVLSVKSLQEKQGDVAAGMVTTINTAVGDAAALISSNMKTVVEASASTTLSVLSATMKSLLNEVIHSAIPAAWKGDPMEEIEQRLRTVIEGAWTGALTVQLTKATEQVNAHTKDAVRQATICIGTRLDSLSVALTAAVESSEVALKYLQRTPCERRAATRRHIREEGIKLQTSIREAQLSILDQIAVTHLDVTRILSSLSSQGEALNDIKKKLETLCEAEDQNAEKQAEMAEILDGMPREVRLALAPDVQRLHQQLKSHHSRSKEYEGTSGRRCCSSWVFVLALGGDATTAANGGEALTISTR